MTQEQLAERSTVGVRTIRRMETGTVKNFRLDTVRLLADALDLTADERRDLMSAAGAVPAFPDTSGSGSAPAEAPGEATGEHKPSGPEPVEPAPGEPASGEPQAETGNPDHKADTDADEPGAPTAGGPEPEPKPAPAPSGTPPPLAEAADRLAAVLQGRWQREMEQRGAHNPFPLPVRWQPVAAELADHWDNVRRVPPGGSAGPLDLTGDLTDIADVFRRVPSGRLVVLGRAGSGKTILTLRFVLDHLATRTRAEPVPVIFGLASWDPTADNLRDWLVDRLLRDHPDLVAPAPGGSTLAAALVEAGRILPVLDGFDEIPEALRSAALPALNSTSLPMLVTCRPHEFREAVAASDVLTWAAGIVITDLTPADFSDYLRRSSRTTRWGPVLGELREQPDSPASKNLTEVLSTPLMVALVRTTYNGAASDPSVLLDTGRFPTPHDLEDHLLGSFVPTVYGPNSTGLRRPDWTVGRVQHWLGHLAGHLDRLGTPDLAWWQLGTSLSRSSRILAVMIASTIVTTLADWAVNLPGYLSELGFAAGLRAGLLDGLLLGPIVGLGFGLVYALMTVYFRVTFEPVRVQVRLFRRSSRTPVARTVVARCGAGLLGGFVVGIGHQLMATLGREMLRGFPSPPDALIRTTLPNMLVYGLVFGLAAGVVFGLSSLLEAPVENDSAASPLAMLRTNRTTVLRRVLFLAPIFMLVIAFGGVLVVALLQGPLGPLGWPLSYGFAAGLLGALTGALSYTFAFTAWGQWLVFSRIWLPLTGRLPWAVTTFLDDAHRRGVLRQVGAVYQFRHARLQDHLKPDVRRPRADDVRSSP
ncbi:helix-turn-helix domain-containing protein [Streptomyces sp. NPDC087440]|uniref:helix-turn-helix domain-containing protein n=1 Tax=Streptomyces sp. NPDC087440 TaxID=3365790 RepID=UPI0038007124